MFTRRNLHPEFEIEGVEILLIFIERSATFRIKFLHLRLFAVNPQSEFYTGGTRRTLPIQKQTKIIFRVNRKTMRDVQRIRQAESRRVVRRERFKNCIDFSALSAPFHHRRLHRRSSIDCRPRDFFCGGQIFFHQHWRD